MKQEEESKIIKDMAEKYSYIITLSDNDVIEIEESETARISTRSITFTPEELELLFEYIFHDDIDYNKVYLNYQFNLSSDADYECVDSETYSSVVSITSKE